MSSVDSSESIRDKLDECVNALISYIAHVEGRNGIDEYLSFSIIYGRLDSAQKLLDHKADVNCAFGGKHSLVLAMISTIHDDHADMMRLLLQNKADISFQSSEEGSSERRDAMYYSIHYNIVECMRILLEHKADPNGFSTVNASFDQRSSYLSSAARRGHAACIRVLLEHNASVEKSIFLDAARGIDLECGRLLLDHKADIHALREEDDSNNALCKAATYGNRELIQFLLEQKADVNWNPDYPYGGALDRAVAHGKLDCAKLLFECKATVGLRDADQSGNSAKTGFMIACYRPHVDCIRWMLDVGADPNVSNRKTDCPLEGAYQSNRGAFELLCCGGNPQTCAHNSDYSEYIAEYMLVHSFISEYHSELTAVLDAVVVDTRVLRSSFGLYHEPLMLVLEYCGLRLKADQVLNEHIEAKEDGNEEVTFTQRLLIPERRGTAAGYWLDLFYTTTEHVQEPVNSFSGFLHGTTF